MIHSDVLLSDCFSLKRNNDIDQPQGGGRVPPMSTHWAQRYPQTQTHTFKMLLGLDLPVTQEASVTFTKWLICFQEKTEEINLIKCWLKGEKLTERAKINVLLFSPVEAKMQKVILRTLFALKTTSPIWNVSFGKCSHWDRGHKLSWNSFPYRKKIHWLWLRACFFFYLYSVLKRYMFQSSWQQRGNSGVRGQRHCITSLYWNSHSQQRM